MSLVLLFAEGRHRTLACGVPGTVPFALPDAQNVNETELYELGRGARRGSKLCGDPRAGWGATRTGCCRVVNLVQQSRLAHG